MSEMLMTEANQTNEGDTQQTVDATTEQSGNATTATEQQAENVQNQQVSDETAVESETSDQEAVEGAPETYEFNRQVADAPNELDPEVDWKRILVDAYLRDTNQSTGQLIPNLDGTGVIQLGLQTRDFKKHQASEFVTWLEAWCAENGVEID